MLIGQYVSKLTDKDRLAVPKKLRIDLGNELIVAKWYENCLVLVSLKSWRDLSKRLIGKTGLITKPVRDIDRFILGSAYEVSLDSQGRFILPEVLKDYSGIKNDVVFLGLGDRVEIWSLEKWKSLNETLKESASKAIEEIYLNEK